MGIVPALALPSNLMATAYLLSFVVGGILAMGVFSALVGSMAGRPALSGVTTQRALLAVCSAIAVVVGVLWIVQ
jgi:hypothetical protein